MSKKTRIIISCILIAIVFGAGTLSYVRSNKALADGGSTGFFVNSAGKIAVPPGGTDLESKWNRGTEDNPFFVLEVVPYEGEAQFGYHIAGCEPADVDRMCWDWKYVYGQDLLYTQGSADYYFWDGEVPSGYTGLSEATVDQCGIMTHVGNGTGNYNLVDEEFTAAEHGDYLWEPLTVEECRALSESERNEYKDDAHEGESFKVCFENVRYYYKTGVKTLTHNNIFLKESVGLKYDIVDGKRVTLPEEEVQRRIEAYKSVVYTVTPEDLNMNLELIERADIIVFELKDNTGSARNAYNEGYAKPELFSHDDSTALGRRKENKPDADFTTNQLDWGAVLAIYERANDNDKPCPVIWNTHIFAQVSADNTKSVNMNIKFADGSTTTKGESGTQNNLYKLYLLLYQMPSTTFEALYGEPRNFSVQNMAGAVTDKNGNRLKTGVLNKYSSADANSYWNKFTLYPWEILPTNDSNVYTPVLDSLEIMGDGGSAIFLFAAGGAQNFLKNSFFLNDGGTQFSSTFASYGGVDDDQYGNEVYEFFRSIGVNKSSTNKVSTAECMYYLLHGRGGDGTGKNNDNYKVLELQPSPSYLTELYWKVFIATHANTTGEVTVDQMTTSEFIGKNVELVSEYDLIYIGMNKLAGDPTMHANYTYAHTGPQVNFPNEGTLYILRGWLNAGTNEAEGYFVHSGNDLTSEAEAKLIDYAHSGAALLFGNGFFTNANTTTPASSIDRNSNIYDLQKHISNKIYEGALTADASHYVTTKTALRTALSKNRRVEMIVLESPLLYEEGKSDAEKYINYYNNSNRTLRYKFTLKAPAGTSYQLALYVDINGDGKFSADENIDVNIYATYSNGNKGNLVTTLQAGSTYIVERTVLDRVGSLSWKLDIIKGGIVYSSLEGLSAVKASSEEIENLCILQILPDTWRPATVYLPQNGEVNGGTVTLPSIIPDYARANAEYVTKTFYELTRNINGMNIEFVRMDQNEVNAALLSDPNYLLNYDMLILGFADMYDGIKENSIAEAVESYIGRGRAVLFTHDNSSLKSGWGSTFSSYFRDMFGMDRYDILAYEAKETGATRADYPYLPAPDSSTLKALSIKNGYLLAQGLTNGTLYRYRHYLLTEIDDLYMLTKKVTQVNKGAITEYPYKIPEVIPVAETHTQYYQLDMERDDIVVWYCLSNDGRSADSENYYAATPNDVRNNYYIYNLRNVTYSGVGHSDGMTVEEIKLFINTFVAAYRATAKPVRALIQNDDATVNNSTGEYFMCVDVNSSDAGKAFGNDIVEQYQLQKGTVGSYELDRTEVAQSKRVYFYIKNENSYGDVQYNLTFSVNGVETPLAVFKKDGDVFMDTKTDATKFKASAIDVYYVDVPLTIETADGKNAIGRTQLTISIDMEYGLEGMVTETSDTVAYIMPRGLFDLD